MRRFAVSVYVLGLLALMVSCAAPAQPIYLDVAYQTQCNTAMGGQIAGCTPGMVRTITGFNGDMGNRYSCSILERGSTRTVSFQVTSAVADATHTPLGLALSGAVVATAGGAPSGSSTFTWTDGNTYGGAAGALAPSATQPCQLSSITFTNDMNTGLPEMDVAVHCAEAPSIPLTTLTRSVSAPGTTATAPIMIKLYSCPVLH
jgi:hypothetical protein